jgi:hypothetical protein
MHARKTVIVAALTPSAPVENARAPIDAVEVIHAMAGRFAVITGWFAPQAVHNSAAI